MAMRRAEVGAASQALRDRPIYVPSSTMRVGWNSTASLIKVSSEAGV